MPRELGDDDNNVERGPPEWFDEANASRADHFLPVTIKATPFAWRDESDIPPRRWLYGKHLLRRFLSVDVAAGGVGKSSVKVGEALAMASNRQLYDKEIGEGPLRVWLYNLEDPNEETERRVHATAKRFHIKPEHLGDRLFVDSGRDQPIIIADETGNGARILRPVVDAIIEELLARHIDVLIVDPFVSSHSISENDNRAIDMVAKEWGKIAEKCNCAINLVHHIRKLNGGEANAESARGAVSLIAAARSVFVYNRMTKEEAENANIPPDQASFHFRVTNDKANLSPPDRADWYRMNNVDLDNGDSVGVACRWQWPDLFDGITLSQTKEIQKKVGESKWRLDPRAQNWVGNIVATVLAMDSGDEKTRKKLVRVVKEWIAKDVLREVEDLDEKRNVRKFVEVGTWIVD